MCLAPVRSNLSFSVLGQTGRQNVRFGLDYKDSSSEVSWYNLILYEIEFYQCSFKRTIGQHQFRGFLFYFESMYQHILHHVKDPQGYYLCVMDSFWEKL